ncbi:MAG: WhiB family transcriptional regulator [Acidimicrobiales bacterium]|nr:WhiB family transcriptional regulator [Acidimicrobiales bacterium]
MGRRPRRRSRRCRSVGRAAGPFPRWHADAACRGEGPSRWFPELGQQGTDAKAVCARCPVRSECRQAGQDEPHGIWAGESPRERRRARRNAQGAASTRSDPRP